MKYVYIKRGVGDGYVSFDTPISQELNGNDLGSTYQDYVDGKWVLLSPEQAAFHDAHPMASIKNVWDMEYLDPSIRTLEDAKRERLAQIEAYDKSPCVNNFTVRIASDEPIEVEDWFTPSQRSNYRSSIDASKLLGVETLQLYVGNVPLSISTEMAERLLAQIQLYADQCFIVTQQHRHAVESLDTIEAVDNYNYTNGYPEKLTFNF